MFAIDFFLNRSKTITKIINSFKKVRKDITQLNNQVININDHNQVIEDRISKLETSLFTSQITTRTTSPKATRSKLKSTQKVLLKRLDQQQLIKAISELIKQGYKTSQIKDEVVERFKIKPTCFYKYLKITKEDITSQITTRTTSPKATRSNK